MPRPMIDTQLGLTFQGSTLAVTQKYFAKYEAISAILDETPDLVLLAHEDLEEALASARDVTPSGRRCRYTSDTVVRILVCQVLEGESLRRIVVRIDDSHVLRQFVRLHNDPMMDFTTLCKLKNAIRPETWKTINCVLAERAAEGGHLSADALRLDTTAVETNVHWPTDSWLLWDVYRVLAGLIEQARDLDPSVTGTRRLHVEQVKKLQVDVARRARGRGRKAKDLQTLYAKLIRRVERILVWAEEVAEGVSRRPSLGGDALAQRVTETRRLGLLVVTQARRRILYGEVVPNDEKLFSIFEPHTELLKRGKAGRPIEFGHMVQIQQVREKFITDYDVFEKKPVEHALLEPALKSHRKLFGRDPDTLAADKGYYESMEALAQLEQHVKVVAIAKKGRRTLEEMAREHDPAFQLGQRFRAGVEGTISCLKRVLCLARVMNKGWQHFASTVGTTIFAHNLLILARQ